MVAPQIVSMSGDPARFPRPPSVPSVLVLDFGEQLLHSQHTDQLSLQHRSWRTQGHTIAYAAQRAATRGACVIAMHRAGDLSGLVVVSPEQAVTDLLDGEQRLTRALHDLQIEGVSPSTQAPTIALRATAMGYGWMGRLVQGYHTPFITSLLQTYGIQGMSVLGPILESTMADLNVEAGECGGHLLAGLAAMGNGCLFCAYGHIYAANLLFFEETGSLGPLDEKELAQLVTMTDPTLSALLLERLDSSPWEALRPRVQRLFALRMGAPATPADQTLRLAIAAWSLITECSLQTSIHLAPPLHSRMARARRLQRAYRSFRKVS
jgi:hypothetical protein